MMRAVIAIVAVLVVVAGIVMLQNRNEAVGGNPSPGGNPEKPAQILKPETHVVNCAEPAYLEDTYTDKDGNVIKVLEKGSTSEGVELTFLRSPKWLNKCQLDPKEEEANKIKETAGKVPGLAVYNFEVQRDDDRPFYVYLYAKWTDTCGNSCWILMNGPEKGGHGPEAGEYHMIKDQLIYVSEKVYNPAWHPLVKAGEPIKFSLKKGTNRIELHTRQDGPTFYQLVVTTEANTPVGGPKKTN